MDSTPPVIFKRTKTKSATRTRQASPDNDEEKNAQANGDDSPSTLATKLKNKVKRAKPKSQLSFGGEDEEESGEQAFKVKKSTLSRKLALGTHPASIPLNLEQATISTNRGPTYDEAYLKELKASTPSARPPPLSDPYAADMSMDVEQVSTMAVETTDSFAAEAIIPTETSIKAAKERRERLRKTGASGEEEFISFEEEDEESVEWMEEQLRRGGHLAPASRPSTPQVKQTYKPTPIPAATPIPTLGPAMARLTEQLALLTTSHAQNTAAMTNLAKERAEVAERETEMREMVSRAEDKRAWFESFREWVEGVAGFLDEKYPLLEALEAEHISLLQERFKLSNTRRLAEDEDDLSIVFGPLPVTPPTEPEVDEVDELGRVITKPSPAVQRRERREARLRRRRLRLQQKPRTEEEEEGYSTDSSLPHQDQLDYASALKSLATRTRDVLADVRAEEFIDPGKGRWNIWRERYTESYVGAWGGLGVVSVWEFWVRLESVGWDCIENPRSLDSFKWYTGLYAYSRPGQGEVGENELGPDGDLVASMISTAVIPRLSATIAGGAFDPYSEVHTRRAIDLSEEVEASVEEGNVKVQILLKSIVTSFESAISETETLVTKFKAIRRGPPAFDPEAIPARRRFLARRLKLLKNLLRWRKYAGERFGVGALAKRLVETTLLDVATSGWEVGGEDLARTAATMLPDDLLPHQLKARLAIR
ncbi:putative nineteen complex-related protein 2 [Lyophyllum shimeji]|uniref:Nineteen complex-related protein 2 n=1 Tax=Lyophyllum shimeji TaxID=47721 RepID=A0A9P3PMU9_LYOSH|nr:putative nineteen complex-related protein 2 [Lyophyllum shimeji]